jgi:hypothetical protein
MLNDDEIKQILVNELTKVGAATGAADGSLNGAAAGAAGARMAGKINKVKSYSETRQFNMPGPQLLALIQNMFDNNPPETSQAGSLYFKKLTHSGFLNMNPTILIASIQNNEVQFSGYALEGLINQHSAEKAVKSLLASMGSNTPTA